MLRPLNYSSNFGGSDFKWDWWCAVPLLRALIAWVKVQLSQVLETCEGLVSVAASASVHQFFGCTAFVQIDRQSLMAATAGNKARQQGLTPSLVRQPSSRALENSHITTVIFRGFQIFVSRSSTVLPAKSFVQSA